ncbi:NAD+ synthase [Salsipaludibacter albus]|uniref:NAD+ synthase n=1 Tax=Salsipaludibacter albus TaxID=2849650 RepID=UPI001EE4D7A5|nr:NAD+ synthase [Salsipaludibacter albus]MBY5162999.1 NAD+ synthase [Salsipaludibacter albus]
MTLRIALAQLATRVGDVDHNLALVLDAWHDAARAGADLVVFPELALPGYPPEDLLLKPEFLEAVAAAEQDLARRGPAGTVAVVGTVGRVGVDEEIGDGEAADPDGWDVTVSANRLRNRALVVADGRQVATYDKWRLPNYGVFDEARYFVPDDDALVVTVAGVPVGITVCEDMWSDRGPVEQAVARGATVVLSLNASPWHRDKRAGRERWVTHHAATRDVHFAWVNCVGGQDDVVFDGDSMVAGPDGTILARGAEFAPELVVVDLDARTDEVPSVALGGHDRTRPPLPEPVDAPRLDPVEAVWRALVLATGDYCRRNGFTEVIVSLSGGIDSAVTAAVAADALGGEHVVGLLQPSPYSSGHSVDDARALADLMGLRTHLVDIEPGMEALDTMLAASLAAEATGVRAGDDQVSVTEENIQSRLRGVVTMALSNATGALVLTTGNKSEYAVGYATLYGDMAGGFAPLKDVPKTLVFELASWRNTLGPAIPDNTITKPPSAELRPGQLDQDSLPPYEVLDDIIEGYVEQDLGIADIAARGHDERVVRDVVRMVDRSEYKRRQAAPGPKVTARAFGKERRVPITHGWRG